jgi:uncharacterized protein
MKRIIAILIISLFCFGFSLPATADGLPRMVDDDNLITDEEESELEAILDEIALNYSFDLVIVTAVSLDGKTAEAYADDYFDYNGYGIGDNYDGALLLVCMEDRDWHISTSGYGITVFTDWDIQYAGEQIVPYLGSGDFYSAFVTFADITVGYLEYELNYGADGTDSEYYTTGIVDSYTAEMVAISAVIGLVTALIVTLIMKSQLKTVRRAQLAHAYIRQGSVNITRSGERFLYKNVVRTRINTDSGGGGGGGSSTHTSSSGRSHGGGGGKF